ncbi:flagellar basal body rod C-terminal domain-containing protein [uncultured Jannaschia sp.]|uniref:FlgK family flagellar hook-associated protein n=1 Tax=uncultured Jannaschia sp. TaxID=293347 RepID=UPI002605573C|nr:flagellar basal body rod C-terminal domain-containing protein [uncultured Jannaschia sp.]
MSISSSLNFAAAGLGATAQRAENVARNVANADHPGYARRASAVVGTGVGAPGASLQILREVDPRLVQLRREAQSQEAGASVAQAFQARLDAEIGDPDAAGSLQDRLAKLDAAFVAAASNPSSAAGLANVSRAAAGVAEKLNALDTVVQSSRQKAETDIAKTVEQLNADLEGVQRLNRDIVRLGDGGGQDKADLLDQRSLLIDRISQQIPVRELTRDRGAVALVSEGGMLLLDTSPAKLEFDARAPISADMTVGNGLYGLEMNGEPVRGDLFKGGRLDALFAIRDETAPLATERLDSLAGELIGRFGDAAVDPSLAAGEPGLFTDDGAVLNPTTSAGLAGRIEVNALVAPDRTDQHWRLRDGLGTAAIQGTGAETGLLLAYGSALADHARPLGAGLPDVAADMVGHTSALRSLISADRLQADNRLGTASTLATSRAEQRDGGAVDVDAEMRRLIEIEQAYAANARVIQAAGAMIDRLMEL